MRPTIQSLCRRHRNEDVHTEHVTALALRLYDGLRAALDLPAADRRLLEAAARLHDVAYADAPLRHVDAAARLLRRTPLAGFNAVERELIADVIRLHGRLEPNAAPPPLRARRLGALLRLADGLDHSHLQDAAIDAVDCTATGVRLRIRTASPANLDAARRKSDLWQQVCPLRLEIDAEAVTAPPSPVRPADGLAETIRRLAILQFRRLADTSRAMSTHDDPEDLHDFRTAARRLRLLLQTFAGDLRGSPGASRVLSALRQSNAVFGPARDADVHLALLRQWEVEDEAYLARRQAEREVRRDAVLRHLAGPAWTRFRRDLGRLARIELSHLPAALAVAPAAPAASRALRRQLARVLDHAPLADSAEAEELHRLRIALRRARYLLEFFLPLLPARAAPLLRRLHRVERQLGGVHDIDAALARLAAAGDAPPRGLAKRLSKERRDALRKFRRRWARSDLPRRLRKLHARLRPDTAASR